MISQYSCHLVFFLTLHSLLAFVASTGFTKKGDFAVLRGTSVIIPCHSPEREAREMGDTMFIDNKWTTGTGEDIDDPRFVKLNSGDLEIGEVQLDDSGIYNCESKLLKESQGNKIVANGIVENGAATIETTSHKLIVYDMAGQKFITTVEITYNENINESIVNDVKRFLYVEVCANDKCEPEEVKTSNCWDDQSNQRCLFEIAYKSETMYADDKCDEECVKATVIHRLKEAENSLRSRIKSMEDPDNNIHPDMDTFNTHHLIICSPGFHLIKGHRKRCFPCPPGAYSGPNSTRCHLCAKGKYQPYYGRRSCEDCPTNESTASIGANDKSDCISTSGIGGKIKEGFDTFISLFDFGR